MSSLDGRCYQFMQVDVFTDKALAGNPLAVFLDGEGLSDAEMQGIAREMNLSETTFVLPADSVEHAARVRIFTPAHELPFAGHPTIGTAFVLATKGLLQGKATEIILEEGIGPVPVRFEGSVEAPGFIWMQHGEASFGNPYVNRAEFALALGLHEPDLLPGAPVVSGSTGRPFLFVPLRNRATVDRAVLDVPKLLRCFGNAEPLGVFVFAPDSDNLQGFAGLAGKVYSRMFAPHTSNVPEDPATGGASGPLGAYLVKYALVKSGHLVGELRILSEQGTKMGRQSFVHIRMRSRENGSYSIEVGGNVVPVAEGVLCL
ncbi:MAG: trans-2,3-dihydro-3-hydroxyanthranilate isomerase [Chloroflexia bacterium]|jgi:trans-2,3-dihydro-3-hydroxyanthranilate isomerase|nr:trans-2,3-dihydro-3-hydroxyanthranilate isomerase [Chloroflexia bacterium]